MVSVAQTSGGWTPPANDLLARSAARQHSSVRELLRLEETPIWPRYRRERDVAHRVDETGEWSILDGFGLAFTIRVPNLISFIRDGSLAHRLGFALWGRVVSIEGRTVTDFKSLQVAIQENTGKRIRVDVIRAGKKESLRLNVPNRLVATSKNDKSGSSLAYFYRSGKFNDSVLNPTV